MKLLTSCLFFSSHLLASVYCVFEMLSQSGDFSVITGLRINLPCRFIMPSFDISQNPIIWTKTQTGQSVAISHVGDIRQPFLSAARFSVHFDSSRPRFGMTLSINGVRREDIGEYECEVRGSNSSVLGYVNYFVSVKEQVSSVRITLGNNSELADKSLKSLSIIVGQSYSIQCLISGGYPFPKTNIYVGMRNVTELFPLYRSCRTTGYRGLEATYCDLVRWTEYYRPSLRDDTSSLNCSAAVPGFDTVKAEVHLQVYYAPVVLCSPTSAEVGDTNAVLTCLVRCKPRVRKIHWVLDKAGTRLDEGQIVTDTWTVITERSAFEVETKLFFGRVKSSNFRKYILVAENDIGVSRSQAELIRVYKESNGLYRPYAPMTGSGESDGSLVRAQSVKFVLLFSLLACFTILLTPH